MNIDIKRWDNGRIIIPAGKYASLKEAVEKELEFSCLQHFNCVRRLFSIKSR